MPVKPFVNKNLIIIITVFIARPRSHTTKYNYHGVMAFKNSACMASTGRKRYIYIVYNSTQTESDILDTNSKGLL